MDSFSLKKSIVIVALLFAIFFQNTIIFIQAIEQTNDKENKNRHLPIFRSNSNQIPREKPLTQNYLIDTLRARRDISAWVNALASWTNDGHFIHQRMLSQNYCMPSMCYLAHFFYFYFLKNTCLILFANLLFYSCFINSLSVAYSVEELGAWKALFNSTNGQNWQECYSEKSYFDPCSECDKVLCSVMHGKLVFIEMHLQGLGLHGTIPSQIGLFSHLQVLFLFSNKLYGAIPLEIFELKNLWVLALQLNELSGTIHRQVNRLTNLLILDFGSNKLGGSIPPELFDLPKLFIFNAVLNSISGTIPPQIGQQKSIWGFALSGNKLTGTIPNEIYHLVNLEIVHLASNSFEGSISPQIGNLKNISILNLHSNRLNGTIPPEISLLTALQHLDLSLNQFIGSIPSSLRELTELRTLDFSHNKLIGMIPLEWNDRLSNSSLINAKNAHESAFLRQLRQLRVCCNQLTGHLRNFVNPLITFSSLARIDFSNNQITGSFQFWPERWFEYYLSDGLMYQGLSSLIIFDLSHNKIQENLPEELPISLSIFFCK